MVCGVWVARGCVGRLAGVGLPLAPLALSPPTIAAILLGDVTTWDHPSILADNVALAPQLQALAPNKSIAVVLVGGASELHLQVRLDEWHHPPPSRCRQVMRCNVLVSLPFCRSGLPWLDTAPISATGTLRPSTTRGLAGSPTRAGVGRCKLGPHDSCVLRVSST